MVSPFIGRELEEEKEWLLMEGCLFKRDQVKMKGITEAVVQRSSVKKLFLEISQNPQEYTYARASFLIKLQAIGLKFPMKFVKFLRTPFFIEHLLWLLLGLIYGSTIL